MTGKTGCFETRASGATDCILGLGNLALGYRHHNLDMSECPCCPYSTPYRHTPFARTLHLRTTRATFTLQRLDMQSLAPRLWYLAKLFFPGKSDIQDTGPVDRARTTYVGLLDSTSLVSAYVSSNGQ